MFTSIGVCQKTQVPLISREQAAEDDAALEKYHEAATKGQYRGKKRDRGVGFGDSDSDEDDEEDRKRRRAMRKKRTVVGGDSLEALRTSGRSWTEPL